MGYYNPYSEVAAQVAERIKSSRSYSPKKNRLLKSATSPNKKKVKYETLKSLNLCVKCARPAEKEKIHCSKCLEYMRIYFRNYRKQKKENARNAKGE